MFGSNHSPLIDQTRIDENDVYHISSVPNCIPKCHLEIHIGSTAFYMEVNQKTQSESKKKFIPFPIKI